MANFTSLKRSLSDMSRSITGSGRQSRSQSPDPTTPRPTSSLYEGEVGVLKWTLRGVPAPAQLALDVLEHHLKTTLQAHAVDTCDPDMAELITSSWNAVLKPIEDRWGMGCILTVLSNL